MAGTKGCNTRGAVVGVFLKEMRLALKSRGWGRRAQSGVHWGVFGPWVIMMDHLINV
jgi:hypothetical protein